MDGGSAAWLICWIGRVEITGPVDRKMIINALNSGGEGVYGGLRGFDDADVGERDRWTG